MFRFLATVAITQCCLLVALPACDWKALSLDFAKQDALSDCRSPNLIHEFELSHGKTFTVADQDYAIQIDERELTMQGAGAEPQSVALHRLPTALDLKLPDQRYRIWLRRDAWGRLLASSSMGMALRGVSWLVDSDLDGRIQPGAGDGLVVSGSRTVGPLPAVFDAWTADSGSRFRRTDTGDWDIQSIRLPKPRDRDHSAAWCHLNHLRQQCGLLPLRYDASLEAGMQAHAEYMHANRTLTHYQDPNRPKASAAGAAAGKACNVTSWGRSHKEMLQEFLLTLFHRDALLAPELSASALLVHQGYGLSDVRTNLDAAMKGGVLIYPPHGHQQAPTRFARGERPHPVSPAHNRKPMGPPIGMFQQQLWFTDYFSVEPQLSVVLHGRRTDRPVSGPVFHAANSPPHIRDAGLTGYAGAISLLPSKSLASHRSYGAQLNVGLTEETRARIATARLRARQAVDWPIPFSPIGSDFRYDWSFQTGR
jgi:hypothetical protein